MTTASDKSANSSAAIAFDALRWDKNGLIPAIIQEDKTGQVLAMFWMNREALQKTLETGKVHSFSRSRNRIALKGESSGHIETVKSVTTDCDCDVLLVRVDQIGAACHEGYYSCFFRRYDPAEKNWKITAEKVFNPEKVYHKA